VKGTSEAVRNASADAERGTCHARIHAGIFANAGLKTGMAA